MRGADRDQHQLVEIQALRAFAALAVLVHHAAYRAGLGDSVGRAGVDIFFVISGFILWTVASGRPAEPLRFAWNRAARIVPLYWLVTLGFAALVLLVPSAAPTLDVTPRRILLSLLFVPHRNAAGDIYPLLVPGWTLTLEMVFYLLFAAALALPRRLQLPAISAAMLALVLAGLAQAPEAAIAATCTHPLLLEFLAGLWLAQARIAGRLPGRRAGGGMVLLGLGAFAAVDATRSYAEAWRVLLWGAPALLVVAGTLSLAAGRTLRLGPVRALGDASYSIYLMHPLLVAAAWRGLGWLPAGAFIAACLLLALAAGLLCFALLERPLTEALKLRTCGRRPVPAAAAA